MMRTGLNGEEKVMIEMIITNSTHTVRNLLIQNSINLGVLPVAISFAGYVILKLYIKYRKKKGDD